MSDDPGLPPLDPTAGALLKRAARASASAPPDTRARVLARVEAVIGGPGGPAGGSPGVSSPPPRRDVSWMRRALPLAASFALGGAVGALGLRALTPPAAPVERIVYVDRPAPPMTVPPAAARDELNPAAPTNGSASPPGTMPAPSTAAAPRSDLAAERQLLDVARHALERQDGAAALTAVTDHERRFPSGILVQEREAMAVRALVIVGRTSEARSRATRFRARFPNSLLLPAVESAVTASSTP
jgi:hypothetical protein